jgi:hypothetical protein
MINWVMFTNKTFNSCFYARELAEQNILDLSLILFFHMGAFFAGNNYILIETFR